MCTFTGNQKVPDATSDQKERDATGHRPYGTRCQHQLGRDILTMSIQSYLGGPA